MAVTMERLDSEASLPRPATNTEAVYGQFSQIVALQKSAIRQRVAELCTASTYWSEVIEFAYGTNDDVDDVTRLSYPTQEQMSLARKATATVARGDLTFPPPEDD